MLQCSEASDLGLLCFPMFQKSMTGLFGLMWVDIFIFSCGLILLNLCGIICNGCSVLRVDIILKDFENASPRLNPLFHKP